MKTINATILVINAGSSTIKFALYSIEKNTGCLLSGQVENMGTAKTLLSYSNAGTGKLNTICISTKDAAAAVNFLMDWLQTQEGFSSIKAIGHRIVYGMKHALPEIITDQLLVELKSMSAYDPEHLPEEINIIEHLKKCFGDIPQIACFDTSFHTTMPPVARLLPIPRRFAQMGIQRYGFHGISYSYLVEELEKTAGKDIAQGKIILAHLGNGASLCAVKERKSIDTTMGFTPASGIPMGTRTGDLDPGVAWFLMQAEKISAQQFNHLVNHESGMLGISETSADMRALLKIQQSDARAAEAIGFFCYQVKKYISAFAGVLGGLETLVFSAGIGENAPEIRRRICDDLQFLGIEIDEERNEKNEPVISTGKSSVCVRVIKTNEQLMIAGAVCEVLDKSNKK